MGNCFLTTLCMSTRFEQWTLRDKINFVKNAEHSSFVSSRNVKHAEPKTIKRMSVTALFWNTFVLRK